MLGLIGAMEQEVSALRGALSGATVQTILGNQVFRGSLAGTEVLLVRSGVGKVNAALATVALVEGGATSIVFTGMAGGIFEKMAIGHAVVATDLIQHDVDVSAFGAPLGQLLSESMTWESDKALSFALTMAAISQDATVHTGRIASGDQFIASHARGQGIANQFDAIAVEMEGAATAQVCTKLGIPFAVLRWISDTADEGAVEDFPSFCERVAELDLRIITALLTSTLSPIQGHQS